LPLHQEAPDAGANPNAIVEQHAPGPDGGGSPRIVFTTALMRAAFSGDWSSALLLAHGADPKIKSSDGETMVEAAAGLGFIQGYSKGKTPAERARGREAVPSSWARRQRCRTITGITPLDVAGKHGCDTKDYSIYLVDGRRGFLRIRLGKKNDGAFRRERRNR